LLTVDALRRFLLTSGDSAGRRVAHELGNLAHLQQHIEAGTRCGDPHLKLLFGGGFGN
jgi:hypothetical protein